MKIEGASPRNALFYRGASMANSFQNGDYLFFLKIPPENIRIGDVIVFDSQTNREATNLCVHRVVAIREHRLITRGDNNLTNDDDGVTEANLIGKVIDYERKGKQYRVWKGRLGMLRARIAHARLQIAKAGKFVLRKPYRLIRKTGLLRQIWTPKMETIRFTTQDGPLVKYIHKGRTVASCWTRTNHWWFKRPYDLVIDPKKHHPA